MSREPHHALPNRESLTTKDIIHDIWTATDLPPEALAALDLPGADGPRRAPPPFHRGLRQPCGIVPKSRAAK
ncbi:hypothetical protein J3458_014514 [Metarhizium acridum]|uniref:uncharacterized protein n=1 Tax=Metarhizium acridum TaxID=92637 RepID=UPI001C6B7B85|nr:hypothetical protein J3458_014514 [Metarhizium acridum]